jgi:hypothetical protein
MRLTNDERYLADLFDAASQPELKWTVGLPDGDGAEFKNLNVGSEIWRRVTANHVQKFLKAKDDNADDDFICTAGVISQRVAYTDFTDGGGTSGTKDLNGIIPAGAWFERSLVSRLTGFAGDTSATLIIGVTGGDTDRYSTGTPSVFTTATQGVDMGAPSGTVWHTAAATPTLLITSGSDWGLVTAGALTVKLFYRAFAL